MKLLSIQNARALWFLHLNDLNPRGRSVERNVFSEIAKRYSFTKVPSLVEIVEARQKNQPIQMLYGVFRAPSGEDVSISLQMYRDALFADTQSTTSDSEAFLNDMLGWLASELGLVDYKTIAIRKLYVSEMIVSLEKSLNMVNPKFSQFAKYLQEKTNTPFKNIGFELGSIGFWIDPAVKHHHVPFRLERQAEIDFSEDRYYSIAPLDTEEHLKALNSLEKLMIG